MSLDVSNAPAGASPLWIIALFIALSEATAGTAAIVTDGMARLIFGVFAAAFPVLVLGVFVWLLVRHAPKLYPPGQYSKEITPEIYRVGITGITRAESRLFARAVAETIVPLAGEDGQADRLAEVESAAQRFELAVATSSVTVSLHRVRAGQPDLQIAVSEDTTVSSFIGMIWAALYPAVEPDSFGRTWRLADERGGELPLMGIPWARAHRMIRDERPVSEVGIFPGAGLAAVPQMSRER